MKRTAILGTLILSGFLALSASETKRPNIILVMADDQGWGQTGYNNHPILKTPNLDKMAENGIRFSRFYAGAPVCSPTRASVLTGRSNDRTGAYSHGYAMCKQEKTIAQALQKAGYKTAHFGKWHLNGLKGPGVPIFANDERNPGHFGFDEWLSVSNFFDIDPIMSHNGEFVEMKGESSHIIVDEALRYIEKEKENKKPLFVVIWFGSPHAPWRAGESDKIPFDKLDQNAQNHYGELVSMDSSIGDLRKGLRSMKIEENTLVWFNSDNGGLPGFGPETVGGLRGFKGKIYEGGLRVPCIIEWPAEIKQSRTTSYPASTMDIFPTIAEIVDLPKTDMISPTDGASIRELFKKNLKIREKPIPFRYLGKAAIVDNNYKLISTDITNAIFELYDLDKDPNETRNIIVEEKGIANRMIQEFTQWNQSVEESIAGKDYPDGLLEPNGKNVLWNTLPEYKPYFEKWKNRPEYKDALIFATGNPETIKKETRRPNILFAIADDQSFPYASAYGAKGLRTPAFDEVAKKGVLFTNAFVAAPQCSPSRAAILTGKNIWQLEEAGTHSSYFPKKLTVFTDLLEESGYQTGFTGKPWAPGNWEDAGWSRNPVGPEYNTRKFSAVPASGISKNDYFENFKDFYARKGVNTPFFFWYGGQEPHRIYEEGSGIKAGKKLSDATVPPFLPDVNLVKSDLLDYYIEIEWFDKQLGKMMQFLREKGELDNTIIVVTADNGMAFPSAKANLFEFGTHVPLAICWSEGISGERVVNELVGLIDLAPTFLEIAKIRNAPVMTGKSLSGLLFAGEENAPKPDRKYILTGRERHSHARPDNLGYPARAIRTVDYLFILNFKPERWPAGDPAPQNEITGSSVVEKSLWPGYHDIDDSPAKLFLIEKSGQYPAPFKQGFEKRPAEELYQILKDPGCTQNLAGDPAYRTVKEKMKNTLEKELKAQGDPRMTGNGDLFDSYPRFGAMRDFPGFKEKGKYNSKYKQIP